MDGDGSIQVNHWRHQSLQYRLIIKLSNITSNYNMLIKIAKVIGGSVRITGGGKDVIWVVNKKETVQEIIKIYDSYPPLTSRKICQLEFLKTHLCLNSVDKYLSSRNSKYINQPQIINSNPIRSYPVPLPPKGGWAGPLSLYPYPPLGAKGGGGGGGLPHYFNGWVSGFIEAEGCFSIRKNNNHSFSIGQNDDIYLINAIKQFFGTANAVRNAYSNFYSIEIYKKETLKLIINHFNNYPLLGEKAESLQRLHQKLQ